MLLNADFIKIKLPPAGTKELDLMYDLLFDVLHAGWGGSFHRAYDAALSPENIDGWVYGFIWEKRHNHYTLSADSVWVKRQFTNAQWLEIDADYVANYLRIKNQT